MAHSCLPSEAYTPTPLSLVRWYLILNSKTTSLSYSFACASPMCAWGVHVSKHLCFSLVNLFCITGILSQEFRRVGGRFFFIPYNDNSIFIVAQAKTLMSSLTLLPYPILSMNPVNPPEKHLQTMTTTHLPPATALVPTTTVSCRYNRTSPPRVSGSHTHHPVVYFQPPNQLKRKSDHTLLWSKLSNSFPSHLVTCTWSVHAQSCPSRPVLSPDPPLSLTPAPWSTLALKLPILPSLLASAWNPLPHYSCGSLPPFFKVFIQMLSCSVGLPWALYLKLQITSHPTLFL